MHVRARQGVPRPAGARIWTERGADANTKGLVYASALNRSRIRTVLCVPLTTNLEWAAAPGNVSLSPRMTGLPKASVANVSLLVALDKARLTERVGRLSRAKLELVLGGIDVVLGRGSS